MEGDVGVKFCVNCKRDIPESNFVMHSVHCQRKLGMCAKCDEAIPHAELAKHNATVHAQISCKACGARLEQMDLRDHERSQCVRRAICCAYCHIETQADELAEHENYCGSRTEKCEECGEFVMLKYRQLHEDSNHGFLKLDDEPGPTPSWNKPTRATSALSNDLSRQRKVLNTTQDRPAAPAHRLSPSKRTNDMPQVNSAAAIVQTKALHKPTIQKVSIPDYPPKPAADPEVSPYAVANRLMERLAVANEMVALPCEFCDAMIPADQLVVHETGCRPDLACYKKPATGKTAAEDQSASAGETAAAAGRTAAAAGRMVSLPCEFCHAMVPAEQLVMHETGCRPDLACLKQSTTVCDEPGLPCEFCGGLYSPYKLLAHQSVCEAATPPRDQAIVNQLGLPAGREGGGLLKQLNKPVANVNPIQPDAGLAGAGAVSRAVSTGAVPKQKAGNNPLSTLREIGQEVPRPASSAVTPQRSRNTDPDW